MFLRIVYTHNHYNSEWTNYDVTTYWNLHRCCTALDRGERCSHTIDARSLTSPLHRVVWPTVKSWKCYKVNAWLCVIIQPYKHLRWMCECLHHGGDTCYASVITRINNPLWWTYIWSEKRRQLRDFLVTLRTQTNNIDYNQHTVVLETIAGIKHCYLHYFWFF